MKGTGNLRSISLWRSKWVKTNIHQHIRTRGNAT